MEYELSASDRFFLNQLIPKWETGKPIDLHGDMKYVFHREKGTNYNTEEFDKTLETVRAFLSNHGFAKEGKQYSFTLLPKGNMLALKGSLEKYEFYQNQERVAGRSVVIPEGATTNRATVRPDAFDSNLQYNRPQHSSSIYRVLIILGILAVLAWFFYNWKG